MKIKFIMCLLVVIVTTMTVSAQRQRYFLNNQNDAEHVNMDYKKNEVRINLLGSFTALPEIQYERFIEDNFGIGAVVGIALDDYIETLEKFSSYYLVYGRLYFGQVKPAYGFYIEGNAGLEILSIYDYSYGNNNYSNRKLEGFTSGLSLGTALGYKFLSRNNWVGEISFGLNRIFLNSEDDNMFPRFGIMIGKRF